MVFGARGLGANGEIPLDSLDGSNGFQILGGDSLGGVGGAIGPLRDLNGDGIDDFFVVAGGASLPEVDGVGQMYVFGKTFFHFLMK